MRRLMRVRGRAQAQACTPATPLARHIDQTEEATMARSVDWYYHRNG
jgi:hypothetical protein